jgi:metal-responsive CopG/Arc/MetJ family transcriptional regulator
MYRMVPARSPQSPLSLRLPRDLLDRLDRLAEKWTKSGPVPVNRSDVIRALLLRAVEQEEKRHGR